MAPPNKAAARGSTSLENVDAAALTRSNWRSSDNGGNCPRERIRQRLSRGAEIPRENRREVRGLGDHSLDFVAEHQPGDAAAGRFGDSLRKCETRQAGGAKRVAIMLGDN